MIEVKEDKMQQFIKFIIDLVDDEFYNYLGESKAEEYFLSGGCLELYKIIKYFIPDIDLFYNIDGHIRIGYQNYLYDVSGKYIISDNYIKLTEDNMMELNDKLGRTEIRFERKQVNVAIINELNMCSGSYVKKIINNLR
ncbi:MAG: hypothetical protein PHN42_02960 [Bacilli bacterium]|nr:hypothetical protein [Bacilli bacterium]